jgi:hypothetical protein
LQRIIFKRFRFITPVEHRSIVAQSPKEIAILTARKPIPGVKFVCIKHRPADEGITGTHLSTVQQPRASRIAGPTEKDVLIHPRRNSVFQMRYYRAKIAITPFL